MIRGLKFSIILTVLISTLSCRKLNNYFRDPDTTVLSETINSTVLVGYAADVAMALIQGKEFSNASISKSNTSFPCSAIIQINLDEGQNTLFTNAKSSLVTIAGIWADQSTAVLTLLFSNYHYGSSVLDLVGIETVPVIQEGDNIHITLATNDIKLNPDQNVILKLNLSTLEIQSELLRLDQPHPNDLYVAVLQKAYFIDIKQNGTIGVLNDDTYNITGGGQLIEITNNSTEINQLAMVDVSVSPECVSNPMGGMALMKVTGLEDAGFPELGTAVFECLSECEGEARVYAATGMFIGSIGKKVPLQL